MGYKISQGISSKIALSLIGGRGLKMILGQALSPLFFLEPLGSYNLSSCVHYALLGSRYGSQFMCDLSKNLLLLSSDPLSCFVGEGSHRSLSPIFGIHLFSATKSGMSQPSYFSV